MKEAVWVVSYVLMFLLAALGGCTCGGARLYPSREVRALVKCPPPSDVVGQGGVKVAWMGRFVGTLEMSTQQYFVHEWLSLSDPASVVSRVKLREPIELRPDEFKETEQKFYVPANCFNTRGPRPESMQAKGIVVLSGSASRKGARVVLNSERPVGEVGISN